MDRMRFEILREMLHRDKILAPIWEYFLEHFGENDEFMRLGTRCRVPFVQEMLEQAAKQVVPEDPRVVQLSLVRIEDRRFLHGTFIMGGLPGCVFYFEEDWKGLAVVIGLPSGETKFLRFTGLPMGLPSRKPADDDDDDDSDDDDDD